MKKIYYTIATVPYSQNPLTIGVTDDGLCYVGLTPTFDGAIAVEDDGKCAPHVEALCAVMTGKVERYPLAVDVRGTAFQTAVWEAVQAVPFGETTSYAAIAAAVGMPKAMRAVGAAIGRNPVLIAVPCHRVVAKSGKLTGFRDGLALKAELLAYEQHCVKIEGQV